MIDNPFDIDRCLFSLQKKRPIFHSEADFQFALSWEIKSHYPDANVRLEYCPSIPPNVHIDILLFYCNETISIELKYKTAKLIKRLKFAHLILHFSFHCIRVKLF